MKRLKFKEKVREKVAELKNTRRLYEERIEENKIWNGN